MGLSRLNSDEGSHPISLLKPQQYDSVEEYRNSSNTDDYQETERTLGRIRPTPFFRVGTDLVRPTAKEPDEQAPTNRKAPTEHHVTDGLIVHGVNLTRQHGFD